MTQLTRLKPARWGALQQPIAALAGPEWAWFWKGLVFALPIWEGHGELRSTHGAIGGPIIGTNDNWSRSPYGYVYEGNGTNCQVILAAENSAGANRVDFLRTAEWTHGVVFMVRNTATDQRTLFGKRSSTEHRFSARTNSGTPPTQIQFRNSGGTVISTTAVVGENVYYAYTLQCDGEASNNWAARVYDFNTAALLTTGTGTDSQTEGAVAPLEIGSTSETPTNDPLDGHIVTTFYAARRWSELECDYWVRDPFGPFRRFGRAMPTTAAAIHRAALKLRR